MAEGTQKVTTEALSFNHPLYLHPSDTQGVSIISQVLVGAENYVVWSRAMTIALRGKNKLGFVNGTCKRELQEESLREQWDRCDAVVLSWLLSSLSKELANGIIFFPNSHLAWMDLQQRFDEKSGSRIFSLHREIHSLRQGSESVTTYYSKLKELWEKQSSLIQIPSCTCETSKAYSDVVQQQKLLTFLMGVNEVHSHARSHILLLFPLPSVNDAYNMIVEDEAQRQLANSDFGGSSNGIAMTIRGRGRRRRRGRGEKIPECTHCNKKGHLRENCYELVGNRPNFHGNKGKQVKESIQGPINSAYAVEERPGNAPHTPQSFTKEQLQQILDMLKKDAEPTIHALTGTEPSGWEEEASGWEEEADW